MSCLPNDGGRAKLVFSSCRHIDDSAKKAPENWMTASLSCLGVMQATDALCRQLSQIPDDVELRRPFPRWPSVITNNTEPPCLGQLRQTESNPPRAVSHNLSMPAVHRPAQPLFHSPKLLQVCHTRVDWVHCLAKPVEPLPSASVSGGMSPQGRKVLMMENCRGFCSIQQTAPGDPGTYGYSMDTSKSSLISRYTRSRQQGSCNPRLQCATERNSDNPYHIVDKVTAREKNLSRFTN